MCVRLRSRRCYSSLLRVAICNNPHGVFIGIVQRQGLGPLHSLSLFTFYLYCGFYKLLQAIKGTRHLAEFRDSSLLLGRETRQQALAREERQPPRSHDKVFLPIGFGIALDVL